MAKTCESCERPLRKGKARRAWVLDGHGGLKQGVVCTRCALRAVSVVVPKPTTVPTTCVLCKKELACVCRGCYNGAASNVRELSAANIALRQTNTLGADGQQRDPCGNVIAPSDADFDRTLGTSTVLIAPEAIPTHVPIRSVRTYTVHSPKKKLATGVLAEEACEVAADAGGHLTIVDDMTGNVVVADTDGDVATIASLEALLVDYERQTPPTDLDA